MKRRYKRYTESELAEIEKNEKKAMGRRKEAAEKLAEELRKDPYFIEVKIGFDYRTITVRSKKKTYSTRVYPYNMRTVAEIKASC